MPPAIVIERLIEQGVAGARRSVTFIGDKERNTGIPKLQHTIGALERILDNVEQEDRSNGEPGHFYERPTVRIPLPPRPGLFSGVFRSCRPA